MKKITLFAMLLMSCMAGMAQTEEMIDTLNSSVPDSVFSFQPFIGYLSYDSALVSMPQYAIVQAKMSELRQAYDSEVKRVEDEFNQKYEAFLDGQRDFPRTILLKRQNELQDLMQRNIVFKQQGRRELVEAEKAAMAPLRAELSRTIAAVAQEHGLSIVVNTDSNACPYIDPQTSIDILEEVTEALAK